MHGHNVSLQLLHSRNCSVLFYEYRCLDSPTGIAITEDEVTVRKLLSFPVLFVAGAAAARKP